jgi:hypothetical protein
MNFYDWDVFKTPDEAHNYFEQQDSYDYVMFGDSATGNERTQWVLNNIKHNEEIKVSYSNDQLLLWFNEKSVCLEGFIHSKLLIDLCSITFPALLLLVKSLRALKVNFDISYIEATEYHNMKDQGIASEGFVISDGGIGIDFIPPFACPPTRSNLAVFLGFEGHRLGALISSEEYEASSVTALLGIPAYKFGLEQLSIHHNVDSLSQLDAQIQYTGANDPYETYNKLKYLYDACCGSRKTLMIAPFGSRPTSFGVSLFVSEYFNADNATIGVVYDFAEVVTGYSTGIGDIHLWRIR